MAREKGELLMVYCLEEKNSMQQQCLSHTYPKKKKSMSFTSYDFSNQMWFLGNTLVEKYI